MHEHLLKRAGPPAPSVGLLAIAPPRVQSGLSFVQLASVLRALQATEAPERGIQIVLETDEILMLLVDRLRLTSAISNLLHAAIEACADGARVILRSSAADSYALVEVEVEAGNAVRPARLAPTQRLVAAMQGTFSSRQTIETGQLFSMALPLRAS